MRIVRLVLTVGLLTASCSFLLAQNPAVVESSRVQDFVKDSPSAPTTAGYEDLSSPVSLLASFYDAVNSREYDRAYGYFETPPSSLDEFERGYANTVSVQLIVQPPTHISGAAGSSYADIPTMLVARQRKGGERFFVGCYTTRKSNLQSSDNPNEGWRIYKTIMSPVPANAAMPRLLAKACRN
jgi:hypothetical protein